MPKQLRANVLAISLAGLFIASAASGQAIWYVDAGSPCPGSGTPGDPLCTIQAAINAAAPNATPPDEIQVADGVYTGTGNKNLDFGGKIIKLRSASGDPAACIIDCQGSGRGFDFHGGETAAAEVRGFTIRNGNVTSSSPSWSNGGGVYCSYSSPTLTNCTISGNTAYDCDGGGVCCSASNATLENCEILANTARQGGGVACYSSSVKLINCTIGGNTCTGTGGAGVLCFGPCAPMLVNCLITGNVATSPFSDGAGVCCVSRANATLVNCTIVGNTCNRAAGGVWTQYDAHPTLTNCIVWGNAPDQIVATSGISVAYCDVQGGYPGTGNIGLEPVFFDADGPDSDPATWQDNDYRLFPGSPCIDAGKNSAVPADALDLDGDGDTTEPIPFDLDGNPRFFDDPASPDCPYVPGTCGTPPIVDMGAYESGLFFAPGDGDLDCSGAANGLDIPAFVLAMLDPSGYATSYPDCNALRGDLNDDGYVNPADVSLFVRLLIGG